MEKQQEEERERGRSVITCSGVWKAPPISAELETAGGRRLVAADVLGSSRRLELPQSVLPVLPRCSGGASVARAGEGSWWVDCEPPEVSGAACCSQDRAGASGR